MANDIYIYMYLLLSFQNNWLRARSIFQSEYLLSNVSVHRSSIEANNVCRAEFHCNQIYRKIHTIYELLKKIKLTCYKRQEIWKFWDELNKTSPITLTGGTQVRCGCSIKLLLLRRLAAHKCGVAAELWLLIKISPIT